MKLDGSAPSGDALREAVSRSFMCFCSTANYEVCLLSAGSGSLESKFERKIGLCSLGGLAADLEGFPTECSTLHILQDGYYVLLLHKGFGLVHSHLLGLLDE